MGAPLKMTDFGLADYCKDTTKLTEISGTPYYIAPEVIRQSYVTCSFLLPPPFSLFFPLRDVI